MCSGLSLFSWWALGGILQSGILCSSVRENFLKILLFCSPNYVNIGPLEFFHFLPLFSSLCLSLLYFLRKLPSIDFSSLLHVLTFQERFLFYTYCFQDILFLFQDYIISFLSKDINRILLSCFLFSAQSLIAQVSSLFVLTSIFDVRSFSQLPGNPQISAHI